MTMKAALAIVALLLVSITAHAFSGYFVFFDWGKSEIRNPPHYFIQMATRAYDATKTKGDVLLLVHGHTDTSEPDAAELSLRRANVVRDALINEGVPAEVITAVGEGPTRQQVPTGPGVREPQNRYARIEFCSPPSDCSWVRAPR
jgi:outer membrane protein OmpA-like peptidoglycan-associated protein